MELSTGGLIGLMHSVSFELMLFASVGILLVGLDDLLFDSLWLAKGQQSNSDNRMNDPDAAGVKGRLAVFIPAWDEAAVIARTISGALGRWHDPDVRLFIGCYSNDAPTLFAVSPLVRRDSRVRLVISDHDGPTTKADNLNNLWAALCEDERIEGCRFAGIVLHDAEDVVHSGELELYRRYLIDHAMVQIPVVPTISPRGRWIGGHYGDEFAEAHGKEMPLRSRLGLPLPSAGVGCALSRNALSLLAMQRGGQPFRADSLTEDYEIGLMLAALRLPAIFVDARDDRGARIVSAGEFPHQPDKAWRQKGRWIAGIALAGWDHLGWRKFTHPDHRSRIGTQALTLWMLWRDRRAPLAAIVVLVAYLALIMAAVNGVGHLLAGWSAPAIPENLRLLLAFNLAMLVWRLGVRSHFVWRAYGWRQAMLSIPRAFVSNIIAIAASVRAVQIYGNSLQSNRIIWDKTDHVSHADDERIFAGARAR